MTFDRRLLAGSLGLAVALAACAGTSTQSPGGSVGGATATPAAATTSPSDAPSADASAGPSPSADTGSAPPASGSPDASAGGGVASPDASGSPAASGATGGNVGTGPAAELAALLPDEAGGVTFTKRALDGAKLSPDAFNLDQSRLNPVLEAAGKTMADVRVAIASPDDASDSTAQVSALQIEGVPAEQVANATGLNVAAMETTTIGGKEVFSVGSESFLSILYPKDDMVFQVMFTDAATAAAILEQLP